MDPKDTLRTPHNFLQNPKGSQAQESTTNEGEFCISHIYIHTHSSVLDPSLLDLCYFTNLQHQAPAPIPKSFQICISSRCTASHHNLADSCMIMEHFSQSRTRPPTLPSVPFYRSRPLLFLTFPSVPLPPPPSPLSPFHSPLASSSPPLLTTIHTSPVFLIVYLRIISAVFEVTNTYIV